MNNKTRIFEFLYERANDRYNINQISRLLGISVGSAFKILKEFEKLKYVNAIEENNALLYQINLDAQTREIYEQSEEEKNLKSKKKTKVICTIGHASNNPVIIKKLIEKGMDVARINASDYDERNALKIIKNIKEASADIPILIELSGLKVLSNRLWIKFALKNDLDFICVSFARSAEDIRKVNEFLGYNDIRHVIGEKIKVIVKIEKESLRNYKEIIEESYGVMVDRDSLAADEKYETLPKLQKMIINECNKKGKPVIIATSMLKSMMNSKHPTQAEVSDIANVVLDGASCLMLSKETESGNYPIEAIETMSRIIKSSENAQIETYGFDDIEYDLTHLIGKAVLDVEKILRIDAVLIITSGGYSARMISSRRLKCKVIAATSSKKIFRQLNLLWGIEPLYVNINSEDISNDEKRDVILKALKKGFIKKKDQIAIIASVFHSKSKQTNLLEIHKVNEFLDYLNKKVSANAKIIKNDALL